MYFSALNIPETGGFGTDICFLGAKEDGSMVKIKKILPPLPVNLLLIFGKFIKSLLFFAYGEYDLFFIG